MKTLFKETQAVISPWMAFEILKKGNERFQAKLKENRKMFVKITNFDLDPKPFALVLNGVDISHHPDIIFDQSQGEITNIPVIWQDFNSGHVKLAEHFCKKHELRLIVLLAHGELFQSAEQLLKSSPVISHFLNSGSLGLIGCNYIERDGKIKYRYETFLLGTKWLCE